MNTEAWTIHNPSGKRRVVVTKELPGERWLEILIQADCRVEVCPSTDILSTAEIRAAMGARCEGAIGQLTEKWDEVLFGALKAAGGRAYSNYAVGFNNIDLDAATRHGLPVGNTPGVLTDTTAEMAVALTFAAARRVVEADRFLRDGRYKGWLPTLFIGEMLQKKTVGIIGAGRIGYAYARMMVEGHKMDVTYYDIHPNPALEDFVAAYSHFLQSRGETPVQCRRAQTVAEVLQAADVVSLHVILDDSTRHLINADSLARMKSQAILVNASRGPVIDEAALVDHCRSNPDFRVGLDVFENEPHLAPGLSELPNVVIVPHIASASSFSRQGMAILAASNVAGILMGYPAWNQPDISPFLEGAAPKAAPSILNAEALGVPLYTA